MSEPTAHEMSNRNPTLSNRQAFANPAFQHQFHKAHVENAVRHLPRPTAAPEPAPHIRHKSFTHLGPMVDYTVL